jgi:heme/copper-type cytochrome/quinol oxidase subunit 2
VKVLGDRTSFAGGALTPAAALAFLASGETNLQETNTLLWVMVGISVAGAIVTFAFLVYSVVMFRDRNNRRRRYG